MSVRFFILQCYLRTYSTFSSKYYNFYLMFLLNITLNFLSCIFKGFYLLLSSLIRERNEQFKTFKIFPVGISKCFLNHQISHSRIKARVYVCVCVCLCVCMCVCVCAYVCLCFTRRKHFVKLLRTQFYSFSFVQSFFSR